MPGTRGRPDAAPPPWRRQIPAARGRAPAPYRRDARGPGPVCRARPRGGILGTAAQTTLTRRAAAEKQGARAEPSLKRTDHRAPGAANQSGPAPLRPVPSRFPPVSRPSRAPWRHQSLPPAPVPGQRSHSLPGLQNPSSLKVRGASWATSVWGFLFLLPVLLSHILNLVLFLILL